MASRDLAGLLTGINSAQRPDPNMNSDAWRMAFGAQTAQNLGNSVGNIGGMLNGGQRSLNPQEAIQIGMGKLDQNNIEDLKTLARMQQMRGDLEGAARTASKIQAMQAQESNSMSLSAQAQAVIEALPTQYDGLKRAIASGNQDALKKGIEILGGAPKETIVELANLVSTTTNQSVRQIQLKGAGKVPHSMEGVRLTPAELEGHVINTTYVKPSAPFIDQRVDPVAKMQADRLTKALEDQGSMHDVTLTKVEGATKNIKTAEGILKIVAEGAPTGALGQKVADWGKYVQNLGELTGIEVPQEVYNTVGDEAAMRIWAAESLIPFIEQQGRGFTDTEREFFLNDVIAGYKQPWQFNDAYATVLLSQANSDLEKNKFAYRVKNADFKYTDAPRNLWADYERKVPRLKLGDKTRNGTTYKGAITIQDNENLSQYWATKDGAPRGFRVDVGGDSDVIEYSWGDLQDTSKALNMTVRELLVDFSRKGHLIGGVY
jgi:hypothetical protein